MYQGSLALFEAACEPASFTVEDRLALADGAYTLEVQASDQTTTEPVTATFSFRVDTVRPTAALAITSTAVSAGTYRSPVTFSATGSDAAGTTQVRCAVDPAAPPTFAAMTACPTGPVTLPPGTHTAYAIARDDAGNESAAASVSFTVLPPEPLAARAKGDDIVVTVPGPGTVHATLAFRPRALARLAQGRGFADLLARARRWQRAAKPITVHVDRAGGVLLDPRLVRKARKVLKQRGKLPVRLTMTFTPDGSSAEQISRSKVVLRAKTGPKTGTRPVG